MQKALVIFRHLYINDKAYPDNVVPTRTFLFDDSVVNTPDMVTAMATSSLASVQTEIESQFIEFLNNTRWSYDIVDVVEYTPPPA